MCHRGKSRHSDPLRQKSGSRSRFHGSVYGTKQTLSLPNSLPIRPLLPLPSIVRHDKRGGSIKALCSGKIFIWTDVAASEDFGEEIELVQKGEGEEDTDECAEGDEQRIKYASRGFQ